jgi:hypothetical protein
MMARRRRSEVPVREPSRLDDDAYAAEVYRRIVRPGYALVTAGHDRAGLSRVAAGRLRQLVALVRAGERVPGQALVDGWRDVLAAEGLADG